MVLECNPGQTFINEAFCSYVAVSEAALYAHDCSVGSVVTSPGFFVLSSSLHSCIVRALLPVLH